MKGRWWVLQRWVLGAGGLFVYFHFSSDTWGIPPTMADNPATHPPTVAVMNYIERANIKLVTQP